MTGAVYWTATNAITNTPGISVIIGTTGHGVIAGTGTYNAIIGCDDFKSRLHLAVRDGNESELKRLLDVMDDVDVKDSAGNTPLMDAVLYNKLGIAKLLLLAGACPNAANRNGTTSLHLVHFGLREMLKLLLVAGANVNQPDNAGMTASMRMAINGCNSDRGLVFVSGGTCESLVGFWPPESILYYRKELDKARADLVCSVIEHVAPRFAQICFALQVLNLPALVTLTILDTVYESEKGLYRLLSMHDKWHLITTIKHANV